MSTDPIETLAPNHITIDKNCSAKPKHRDAHKNQNNGYVSFHSAVACTLEFVGGDRIFDNVSTIDLTPGRPHNELLTGPVGECATFEVINCTKAPGGSLTDIYTITIES